MNDFERARADLPNTPEDVFRLWLDPIIVDHAWKISTRRWQDALLYKSLAFWQNTRWVHTQVTIHPSHFSLSTEVLLKRMSIAFAHNLSEAHSEWSRKFRPKIKQISRYITRNGRAPGTLVLHQEGTSIDILDGAQRVLLLYCLSRTPSRRHACSAAVDAWVNL